MNNYLQGKTIFNRSDLMWLALIMVAAIVIYYPVFYTNYIYTDEAPQFWLAEKGVNNVYIQDGRWFTAVLNNTLFSHANTVKAVMHIRLFSFAGWMICLPVWYYIIKDLVAKNNLPIILLPVFMLYLICTPPFAVYIGWAVCQEMFIACTCGLLSGYILYRGIHFKDNELYISKTVIAFSFLTGILSLFTYQTGFGCFYIPFFIQFVANKKFSKQIVAAIGFSMLIYIIYFLLFKRSLRMNHIDEGGRSLLSVNPVNKLFFLFTRPLASAFHFTFIFNEKSIAGEIIYMVTFIFWFVLNFINLKAKPLREKLFYYTGVIAFFIFAYLPPLLVVENYSSNRTLFALNLIVFILFAETIFSFIKNHKQQYTIAGIIAVLFFSNAWYNFRWQFIYPLAAEYSLIKTFVDKNYTSEISTVYMIRPAENAFEKKYGIAASWDEFGVPSTAKIWTPETLLQKMIFEKNGDHKIADKLIVKSWEDYNAFIKSGERTTKEILLIDVSKMLEAP